MKTMSLNVVQRTTGGHQDRQVPAAKEKTAKLFAGIYESKRFSAASARKAFAGLKPKK